MDPGPGQRPSGGGGSPVTAVPAGHPSPAPVPRGARTRPGAVPSGQDSGHKWQEGVSC